MKLLTKEQCFNGVNTKIGISLEKQKELRMGNVQYIIDSAIKADLSTECTATAIILSHYFFTLRSYLNDDRFIMNNACLFLAGKIMNEKKRESHYCMHYHNMKHQGTVVPPLGIKEMAEVKNKISIAEAKLLRTIEFNFNIPLPYSYLNFYISTLYPEEQLKMKQVCTGIVNDVFLTTIPLRSSPRALSISCIIIGAILLGMPPLYDKYFREDDWMNVKNSSIMEIQIGEENMFMELTEEDYLAKTWTDRVHPTLKLEDIIEIVEEISALYESALKEK